jgi:hypothetical protein
MAELKTKQTEEDVSRFLDSISDESKRRDCYVITEMMTQITGKKPKMWGTSIIGFGSYHYKYASGHEGDAAVVCFSPRKQNISLYLMAGYVSSEYPGYENLLKNLGKFKMGKGCLYINKLEDVNIEQLKELIGISFEFLKKKYPAY